MKLKKFLALLCAVAVGLTILVLPSSATGSIFFLSLNDTLPAQSVQTAPIQSSGWVYVPTGVFNSRTTGINFGIYYGLTDNNESLVFYNLSGKTMTFHLDTDTATTSTGETPVPGRVIRQNGQYYVPAYAVCRFFGLTYSFYSTDYGPLLRIKDSNAVLSDTLFLSSAASIMRSRTNSQIINNPNNGNNGGNNQTPSTPTQPTTPTTPTTPTQPTTPTTPTTPVTPDIPDDAEPAPTFSLYLAVRAQAGVDLTATLNAVLNTGAIPVVFFPAGQAAQCADQIRQAAGRGCKVGLIPSGDTGEAKLESIRTGSQALAAILRQETWFVLGEDETLANAGYLCWTPSLTLQTVTNATTTYNTLVRSGDGASSPLRVLFQAQTNAAPLAGVLTQLKEDGDTFLAVRETKY